MREVIRRWNETLRAQQSTGPWKVSNMVFVMICMFGGCIIAERNVLCAHECCVSLCSKYQENS